MQQCNFFYVCYIRNILINDMNLKERKPLKYSIKKFI